MPQKQTDMKMRNFFISFIFLARKEILPQLLLATKYYWPAEFGIAPME